MKYLVAFLVCCLSLTFIPSVSRSDGCFVNRSFYSGSSYTPSYSYQKAYVAPSYQHQDYHYVPKVVEVVVASDYYYSVGSYYRDKLLSDSIVGRLAELQLKNQSKPSPATDPAAPQSSPPLRQVPMPPVETPPPGGVGSSSQGTLEASPYQDASLLAVINRSCAECHNATVSKGKFSLVTADGKLASVSEGKWWKAFSMVSTGEMPTKGKPLSDEETVLFHTAAKAAEKFAHK